MKCFAGVREAFAGQLQHECDLRAICPGGPMHVLIVDDEADFLELMEKRLQKRGFSVTTAGNGEEGLKQVQQTSFDAMVLDVKMPGMDGIETLRRIKQLAPDLPVLLLTGHASIESAMVGVESGAVDYLLKPVPLNDLIMRLNDMVGRKG
jgi:DNA-binding response OmpR family regulator